MTKLAEVSVLYESNARSIPAMLRKAADSLENDPECTARAMVAVQIDEEGRVAVYGWGETDTLHAAGLLHVGLQQIVDIQLDSGDDE